MNTIKEIKNVLEDLSIYELEEIKCELSKFIESEHQIRYSYIQNWRFFESDFRKQLEVGNINYFIKEAIFNFGTFRVHNLVIGILKDKKSKYINTVEKFNELQEKIVEWGRANNINDAKSQFLKIVEKFGEIQLAENKEEFEDAIGDTLVTLIILNDILQKSVKEDDEVTLLADTFLEEDLYCYAKRKGKPNTLVDLNNDINNDIIIELSRIAEYISKMTNDNRECYIEKICLHILEIVKYVRYFAEWANTDYIESLQIAYDSIANRLFQ